MKSVDVKNSVVREQRKTCLASLVEVCPSRKWAFDCPLCPLVFGSAAFTKAHKHQDSGQADRSGPRNTGRRCFRSSE